MPISQASAPAGQEPPAPLAVAPQALARIRAMLAQKPDGVIEAIAREVGVPTLAVLEATPAAERAAMPPARFEALWHELAGWGEVLFIVHTPDIVLECTGALPRGSFGHGYYNIHGDSPIGGHIKAEQLPRHLSRRPAVSRPALLLRAVLQRRGRGHVQALRPAQAGPFARPGATRPLRGAEDRAAGAGLRQGLGVALSTGAACRQLARSPSCIGLPLSAALTETGLRG